MVTSNKISAKLQAQLDAYEGTSFKPGDMIMVEGQYLNRSSSKDKKAKECVKIKEIKDDVIVVFNGYKPNDTCEVSKIHCNKYIRDVGVNPFPAYDWHSIIEMNAYDLDNIFCLLADKEQYMMETPNGYEPLKMINWNPYIIDKEGNKQYYQRDFCWTLKDKQLLIESIYNHINCGIIVVRERDWDYLDEEYKKGNTEAALNDIVDGKQRLSTVFDFVNDKFPDLHGNYFSDFSQNARREFGFSHCFTLGKIREKASDKDVLRAFLGVNFTGVPMSAEHIEYVQQLNNKI